MVRIKHTVHPIGDEAHLGATDAVPHEVAEALLSQMSGSAGVASSPSREGSPSNASDSGSESQSVNFNNELTASDSDSMKRAKVVATTAAAGIIFDFGMSSASKARVRAMERVSYFAKGHDRPPDRETMPTPGLMRSWVSKICLPQGFVCLRIQC
jgi:hypothetical protein